MPVASAASHSSALQDYTGIEGVTVGKNFENREIRESLVESQKKMAELVTKYAN